MAIDPNRRRRQLCLITIFILGCASLSMLSASYGTENWIEATPVRNIDKSTTDAARNLSNTKLTGSVRFGLFRGLKVLDNGLGPRTTVIDVYNDVRQSDPTIPSGTWVALIVFGVLSGAFGITSSGFALLNISRKPVLGLSGPGGLYAWNAAWLSCLLVVVVVFGSLFGTKFSGNVLSGSDTQEYKWTSSGLAWLGYSYWLLVGCCACCVANLMLAWLAGARLGACCLRAGQRQGRRGEVDLSIVY